MPIVHVVEARKNQRRLLSLVFPVRNSVDAIEAARWTWPELHVARPRAGLVAAFVFSRPPIQPRLIERVLLAAVLHLLAIANSA